MNPEFALASLCLIYAAIAYLVSPAAFLAILEEYTVKRVQLLPLFLGLALTAIAVFHSPRSPVKYLRERLPLRLRGASIIVVIFFLSLTAFSVLKHEIAISVPFFADVALADLDELIHRTQPWRLAHAVWPDVLAPVLLLLYSLVWLMQVVCAVPLMAFSTDRRLRFKYYLSLIAIIFGLGTIGRIVANSAGPIFYDRLFQGDRFADLLTALDALPETRFMLNTADYLYASYQNNAAVFGAGISAMPSVHVAVAVLHALLLGSINRWLGLVGWLYAAAILLGSVYFGWHYALDGYVSIACVLIIWRMSGVVSDRVLPNPDPEIGGRSAPALPGGAIASTRETAREQLNYSPRVN